MQPKLEGDRFVVPDTPGLGVEFNEEMGANQTFTFWGGTALAAPRRVLHQLVGGADDNNSRP